MSPDFPTAPPAYGLNGPSAAVTVEKSPHASHTEILTTPAIAFYGNNFIQLKGLGFTCTLEKLVKLKLINARFGEVPFMLRYDQKQSASKMVSSVTTLGYLVMTLLYHWPWGGWRTSVRRKHGNWTISNDAP